MPETSHNADKREQGQPFQNRRRIKLPLRVDRHQSDRNEKMCGIPPDRHCGIDEAARKRPDNNVLLTDAAALEPHGDHAHNSKTKGRNTTCVFEISANTKKTSETTYALTELRSRC